MDISKFSLSNIFKKARELYSQVDQNTQTLQTGYSKLMDITGATALKQRQQLINQRVQPLNFTQRINRVPQVDEQQLLGTGLQRSAKTVGTIMMPKQIPLALGSAALGFGATKIMGGTTQEALQSGIGAAQMAPVYGGLARATSPLISRVLPAGGGVVANRAAPAIANAAQGAVIDAATGNKTTPLSVGLDLVTGGAFGKSQFRPGMGIKATRITDADIQSTYGKLLAEGNPKRIADFEKKYIHTQPTKGVEPQEIKKAVDNPAVQQPPKNTPPPPKRPRTSVDDVIELGSGGSTPPKFTKLDEVYTQLMDRFHPLSKLAKAGGKVKEMARSLAKYYGSGSTATYHLQEELSPILKQHDVNDLKEAAVAMRDVELNSRDIKGSPAQKQAMERLKALSDRLGKEKMQSLGQTLDQLYKYQDAMVRKYMVETGVMSEKAFQSMKSKNQYYVPMKRVMDTVDEMLGIPVKRGAGSVGKQNVIYKIKGSDRDIIDPVESIIENTYKLVSLGRRQEVARTVSSMSKAFPDLIKRTNIADQRSTISLFEKGKKVYYTVPPEVADAARGMSEEQLTILSKVLKVPTDFFRTMTTGINPEFTLPNVARDTQSALFNTGLNPLKWVAGLAHYAKGDQVYKDFLQSGAMTSRISTNREVIKKTAQELSGQKAFTIKSPKDIIRGLELLGQYSEQPTRVAVFEDAYNKALKSGLSREEALSEAAYWAQEGTVNFARRGSIMTNVNAVYAYLNARMQGVDRMVRTAKNNPGSAAVRFGIGFLAPALSLYAYNSQHPDYYNEQIVSERDKKDNFIFMLPGEGVGGARFLKLPKSEIGKIVNPTEEFLDYVRGRGDDVGKSILDTVLAFSPIDEPGGIIPTALKPPVEQAVNKNFYFKSDIVPQWKKDYPAGYQDTNYTAPLYRAIGQKTNISPARLQHLSESYLGGLGRVGELATRPLIPDQYKTPENERGANVNQMPVVRRFAGGEKMTDEEFLQKQNSQIEGIEKRISTLQNRALDGTLPEAAADKKIDKLAKELNNVQNSDYRVGSLAPEKAYEKKIDLKLTDKITEDEASAYFLREVSPTPLDSPYAEAIRQKKIWSRLSDIQSSDSLSDAQKDMATNAVLKTAGMDRSDYDYYQIAKENNDIKSLYATEQLTKMMASNAPKEEILDWLTQSRREVNGNQLLTSGVIDSLVDQNILSYQEGKQLKALKITGVSKKKTSTRIKKPKKISVKAIKPPKVKVVSGKTKEFKPVKVKKIATRLKVSKKA